MSFNRTVSRLGLQTFLPNFSGPLNRGPWSGQKWHPKAAPPYTGEMTSRRGDQEKTVE